MHNTIIGLHVPRLDPCTVNSNRTISYMNKKFFAIQRF